MAVNVLGTWHVLLAAEAAGVTRVVDFSSAQALGIAEGERLPDYFPVDDEDPRRAMRPCGLSKCLAEDVCQGFAARTGMRRCRCAQSRSGVPSATRESSSDAARSRDPSGSRSGSTARSSTCVTSRRRSSAHSGSRGPATIGLCCAPTTSRRALPASGNSSSNTRVRPRFRQRAPTETDLRVRETEARPQISPSLLPTNSTHVARLGMEPLAETSLPPDNRHGPRE